MVDGSVNRPVCKGMLEAVLYNIMSRPGLTQQTLLETYKDVLQPMALLDLVQVNTNPFNGNNAFLQRRSSCLIFYAPDLLRRRSSTWAVWRGKLGSEYRKPRCSAALCLRREVRQRWGWRNRTGCITSPPSAAACGSVRCCPTNATGTIIYLKTSRGLLSPHLGFCKCYFTMFHVRFFDRFTSGFTEQDFFVHLFLFFLSWKVNSVWCSCFCFMWYNKNNYILHLWLFLVLQIRWCV